MPGRPPILVFSGIDGAGKSTQIERVGAHLHARSLRPVYVWSRGGYTPGFLLLKRLLRRSPGNVLPPAGRGAKRDAALGRPWVRKLWLWISVLDLAVLYGVSIRWWRFRGRAVVCDRYIADTAIDFQLNFPQESVEHWWSWRLMRRVAAEPDVKFLLLIPVEESLRRSVEKDEPFPDDEPVLRRRLQMYERLRDGDDGYVYVDGTRPVDEVFRQIRERIDARLKDGDR